MPRPPRRKRRRTSPRPGGTRLPGERVPGDAKGPLTRREKVVFFAFLSYSLTLVGLFFWGIYWTARQDWWEDWMAWAAGPVLFVLASPPYVFYGKSFKPVP